MDIEKIKQEFENHYKKYDFNNPKIIGKYQHSIRVMNLSRLIAESIGLDDNNVEIAMIIGLLHDYARFEQWTKYQTFSDIKSIDHGDLAVEMLFDNNEIEKYLLNKENYNEIYDAIKYHNKKDIPDKLSERNKLFSKVVRDADKLDILYLLGINEELFEEDDKLISKKISDAFYKGKIIDRRDSESKNDNIVLYLAMIFDLNFKGSFKYLYDNNLVCKIYDKIKDKNKFNKYFEYIYNYIQERMV